VNCTAARRDHAFERRVARCHPWRRVWDARLLAVTIGTTQIRFAEQTFGPNGVAMERVETTLPIG
jgi:hypothetical protein